MHTVEITRENVEREELRRLYETAFPKEEQIPYEDLKRLMTVMPLDFKAWYEDDTFIGFTMVYRRPERSWFWYFAVQDELRGRGYGEQILQQIKEMYSHQSLILDIESPTQDSPNKEQRIKRHAFYLRNGFKDTYAYRTFRGITFTILQTGDAPFTVDDYNAIISELNSYWDAMPTPE